MNSKKKKYRKTEDANLWLTNIEFSSRSEKSFVKKQLVDIAEKIAFLRKKKQLSQEALAELARVSVSTIKFIEQKQRVPSLVLLLKLIYIIEIDNNFWL